MAMGIGMGIGGRVDDGPPEVGAAISLGLNGLAFEDSVAGCAEAVAGAIVGDAATGAGTGVGAIVGDAATGA
jgi:hypothetical protein